MPLRYQFLCRMQSFFWDYEGQEQVLHIYPQFVIYNNVTFFEGVTHLIAVEANQIIFNEYPQNQDIPKMILYAEDSAHAQRIHRALLRIWYEQDTDGDFQAHLQAAVRAEVDRNLQDCVAGWKAMWQTMWQRCCPRRQGRAVPVPPTTGRPKEE